MIFPDLLFVFVLAIILSGTFYSRRGSGVGRLPLVTIGFITALIIGIFSPPPADGSATAQYERAGAFMWGFFWIVLILLGITIATGYAV